MATLRMAGPHGKLGCERPKTFRALGQSEPPLLVHVHGNKFYRNEIFKHDSWAATATYKSEQGQQIVCKFNRQSPIGPIPMRWLGRFLARREYYFLKTLGDTAGIPRVYDCVLVHEQRQCHAVAHEFIPGNPLSLARAIPSDFFDQVEVMLAALHARRIAYVDLHKQENVIVGDDGKPYLIDFQVSVQLPAWRWLTPLFSMLRQADLYHVDKHRWLHRQPSSSMESRQRPWWLTVHRTIAVPLRTLRRRFLVAIGIRRGDGHSATEAVPEIGLRRSDAA